MPFLLAACASGAPVRSKTCPDVDAALVALDRAPEAASMARRLGLTVDGGRVKLALVLAANDPGLLARLGLEGSGRGSRIQAFVPFDRICELGSLPEIVAVRAPAPAFEQ